jgi:hypothetical protein
LLRLSNHPSNTLIATSSLSSTRTRIAVSTKASSEPSSFSDRPRRRLSRAAYSNQAISDRVVARMTATPSAAIIMKRD